jgi:hypothetical protein
VVGGVVHPAGPASFNKRQPGSRSEALSGSGGGIRVLPESLGCTNRHRTPDWGVAGFLAVSAALVVVASAGELVARDARIKELIRQVAAPGVKKVAAILQAGIERRELTGHAPPEVFAFRFITVTNMLLLQSWESPTSWPRPTDRPAAATAPFLHGVAATRTSS